jgi:hypothetical protein
LNLVHTNSGSVSGITFISWCYINQTPGLLYCKQHVMCVNNRIETNYLIWQAFHIPLYYINEIDQQIFMFCHPESQIVKKKKRIPRHIHTHTIKCRTKSHAVRTSLTNINFPLIIRLYNTMECGTSVKSDNSFRFDCSHTSHAAYNRVDLVLTKT